MLHQPCGSVGKIGCKNSRNATAPTLARFASGFSLILGLAAALELDQNYAAAHGYAAWGYEQRYLRSGFDQQDRAAALKHAHNAVSLGASDPLALSIGAFVHGNITRDYESAIEILDRALKMNANSALAFGFSALANAHSEHHERAIDHARSIQTSAWLTPISSPVKSALDRFRPPVPRLSS